MYSKSDKLPATATHPATPEGSAARALHWCHNMEAAIKAYMQGEIIQMRMRETCVSGEWWDSENPIWSTNYEYRIKPKPVEVEMLINKTGWADTARRYHSHEIDRMLKQGWRRATFREVM